MSDEANDTFELDEEEETQEDQRTPKDRGSLAGKLLIALLLILIFTQGILTWKVMTMSSEQVVVRSGPAPVQQESGEYESLRKDLLTLKKQKEELESVLPGLKYEVSVLIEQAENLKSTVKRLQKVKTRKAPAKKKDQKPEKKAQPVVAPVKKAVAKEKPAPEKESKKVAALKKYWTLHIWSFKSLDNAKDKVRETKKKGAPAYYRLMEVPGKGKWFRVFIGKYKTREEAEKAGVSLKARGIVEYSKPTELD